MPVHRRRNLVANRRRVGDEDEDEEDGVDGVEDDSQSDASVQTGADNDPDADDSEVEEADAAEPGSQIETRTQDRDAGRFEVLAMGEEGEVAVEPNAARLKFKHTADTDAMASGLKLTVVAKDEEPIDFDGKSIDSSEKNILAARKQTRAPQTNARLESAFERRRKDHEEYKKQRDTNPAFVPNRGGFFMHDQRSSPGLNGYAQMGRGRGRGRGIPAPSPTTINPSVQPAEAMNAKWDHDLHETVTTMNAVPAQRIALGNLPVNSLPQSQRPLANALPDTSARSNPYSKSSQIANVQIRVFLPHMKEPRIFSGVPFKQHTRLPNLRPPLRRDKPVRISLPNHQPRYNFPKVERSFIFIPRAERPNQQGGKKIKRGNFSQQGSRRNSIYGGSAYTPSVAMSRRSSQIPDGVNSPVGSISSRPTAGPVPSGPPVVRLPAVPVQPTVVLPSQQHPETPSNSHQLQTYPLPQEAEFRERHNSIPMHQPRPQKTVSVAGIESPTSLPFRAPQQQEQQPFDHQLPSHMNGQPQPQDTSAYYSPSRQVAYPGQGPLASPLSNIPERAIHAQPFQPGAMPQQAFYPQMYPVQNMYYYAPGQQTVYPSGAMAPVFVQQPSLVPMLQSPATGGEGVPGTVGHDGTTYFYDPTQLQSEGEGLPQSYAVPGMGGYMTPSPEGYFYGQHQQGMAFYAPQEFVPSR